MGVYIKGMEMPKSCFACPLVREDVCGATEYTISRHHWKDRADICPLVPVPPHGDLIEYDFCLKNYELLHDDDGNPVYAVRMRDINNALTIIPEDGKDTDVPTREESE